MIRDVTFIVINVIITYLIIGFFVLAGLSPGSDVATFRKYSGYGDPLSYQSVGASVLVLSMVVLSAMGQYASSASMSGRLEAALAAPVGLGTAMAASSVPMVVFGAIHFAITMAPIMYVASSVKGALPVLASLGVLVLGMLPLLVLGALVSLAVIKLGTPAVLNLVQALLFSLSGTLYPVTILPEILRILPQALPVVHIAEALRSLLLPREGAGPLGVPSLLLVSAAYGLAGTFIYRSLVLAVRSRGVGE